MLGSFLQNRRVPAQAAKPPSEYPDEFSFTPDLRHVFRAVF